MVNKDQARQLLGLQVVDTAGDKVGTVNDVYLNDRTNQLSWVTVATRWFGLRESFLPLKGARIDDDRIRVPFDKATIKNAPRYQSGVPLTPQEEDELYRHYNLPVDSLAARSTTEKGTGAMRYARERATGQARLRKYVITEQQTIVVPVSHQEAHVEREPITDHDRNQESPVVEITEEEREIVLHAERPVVTTESVPVGRVRLDRTPKPAADEETVTGAVGN